MESVDSRQLLIDARGKAEKLIVGLVAWHSDLGRFADRIAPDRFAAGRAALAKAIAEATRTRDNIDQALDAGSNDRNDRPQPLL